MSRPLRRGYTTGVHCSFAFRSALESFVQDGEFCISKSKKMDNDDLDVTKGCEIEVTISSKLKRLLLNPINHKPYILSSINASMELFAGEGVGVVTKNGLKPPLGYPAINPKPLKVLQDIFSSFYKKNEQLFCTVGIKNGENIALESANAKVGVLGGLSILGTTGFVKPISNGAYLDAIEVEIKFAIANGHKKLYLTLGNSAFESLIKRYPKESIIEIGNFVYDAIEIARSLGVEEILFVTAIGKMTKVAQGCKNTHNRFGEIDFCALQREIKMRLCVEVDMRSTKSVRGILEELRERGKERDFYKMIKNRATNELKSWFPKLQIEVLILDYSEIKGW